MNTALALDHVGVAAQDLLPLTQTYERLGFTLSPIAQQSGRRRPDLPVELFGSGNRCAFFRHGYLELIAILDPTKFVNTLDRFLARYAGMHILALAIGDEQANLDRLRAAGVDIPGIAWLERPVEAGGPIARFARLPFPDPPEGRVQLIRHLTPELVWQDRWMDHANGVVALETAILSSDTPAETAERLSRLTGLPLDVDPAGGFLMRFPGAAGVAGPRSGKMETRVRILTPDGLGKVLPGVAQKASPFMAGMVLRTADGAAAARRVLAGIPTRDAPDGLMVPPEAACGAALVFA